MTLQGSWSFEENTGSTSVDTSGSGRTMTAINGWTTAGHTGNGLLSSGAQAGAQVIVDSTFALQPSSTFMCWVKFNSVSTFQEILYGPRYGSSGIWYVGLTSTGRLTAAWGDGSMTGTTALSAGVWYHIAFAFDWASGDGNNSAVLYINAVSEVTSSAFPLNPGTLLWGGNLDANDGDVPLNGFMDDARWYSERLTQPSIQTLMTTPVASLLASSGTRRFLKDQSGNWQPIRTERIVGAGVGGTIYGWQLTKYSVGLNKYGINGDSLPIYKGVLKPLAGTVIRNKKITSPLDLSNGNITIEKCLVQPTSSGQGVPILTTFDSNGVKPGDGPVSIIDCTIEGSQLSQFSAAMSSAIQAIGTIRGNYIYGLGSGISVLNVGTQFDGLVEGNYVTGLVAFGDPATTGNHSDGFTVRDFDTTINPTRQLVIQNNRFDERSGNDTGALFIQTNSGKISNVIAQGNLLEGGGYNMALNEQNHVYSNIRSINNRFQPTGYGPSYVDGGMGYTQWTDNYLNDPAQPDNRGSVVGPG
jgi:Concanavalin A-like lectin/glucanases superfamily